MKKKKVVIKIIKIIIIINKELQRSKNKLKLRKKSLRRVGSG
jgi:hypothetical protein